MTSSIRSAGPAAGPTPPRVWRSAGSGPDGGRATAAPTGGSTSARDRGLSDVEGPFSCSNSNTPLPSDPGRPRRCRRCTASPRPGSSRAGTTTLAGGVDPGRRDPGRRHALPGSRGRGGPPSTLVRRTELRRSWARPQGRGQELAENYRRAAGAPALSSIGCSTASRGSLGLSRPAGIRPPNRRHDAAPDLRGRSPSPARAARLLAQGRVRRRRRAACGSRRSARRSATVQRRGAAGPPQRYDGRPERLRVPADIPRPRPDPARSRCRAALECPSPGPGPHADQVRTDTTTRVAAGASSPNGGFRRPGRSLRPGGVRSIRVRSSVVPRADGRSAHLPSPARRNGRTPPGTRGLPTTRFSPRAPCSASRRSMPSAAPRRSPRSRSASPLDGDDVCEPVSLVTGPGNIYVAAAKRLLKAGSASTPRLGRPRSPSRRRERRPDHVAADLVSQARARPTGHERPSSPTISNSLRRRLVTPSPAELERRHSERVQEALTGPQSAIVLVMTRPGLAVVDAAYGAEHLRDHDRRRAVESRASRPQRRRDFVGASARSPRRLRRRVQSRAADGRMRRPQQRAVGAIVSAGRPRRALRPCRARSPMSPRTSSRSPRPRTRPRR